MIGATVKKGNAVSSITDHVRKFLDDLATDAIEERVVEYLIREVQNGRKLTDALKDPYVRNRLSEDRLNKVLENPEVIGALEQQISSSFQKREFGFHD